ncbi:MAG: hypothetical protein HGB02_01930 [Chlorobiaceae bacterium]|nr:hypothetical protein [Chlorobiaceae bacterium]
MLNQFLKNPYRAPVIPLLQIRRGMVKAVSAIHPWRGRIRASAGSIPAPPDFESRPLLKQGMPRQRDCMLFRIQSGRLFKEVGIVKYNRVLKMSGKICSLLQQRIFADGCP